MYNTFFCCCCSYFVETEPWDDKNASYTFDNVGIGDFYQKLETREIQAANLFERGTENQGERHTTKDFLFSCFAKGFSH